MKISYPGLVAALILTLGIAAGVQHTASAASMSCGPLRDTCADDTQPVCRDNQWRCESKSDNYSTTKSSSSVSTTTNECGANNVRCMYGYVPECAYGVWTCIRENTSSSSSSSSSSTSSSCMAMCPDGFQYRTCAADGSPINYFADPCMNHQDTVSCDTTSILCITGLQPACVNDRWQCVSPAEVCGPNTMLCAINKRPKCMDGEWTCMEKSSSSSRPSSVHITSVTPSTASVRGMVTIEGTGFARRGNVVLFEDTVIPNIRSLDGEHLTFRVPTRTMRACYFQFSKLMTKCEKPIRTYTSGDYDVSVRVKGDVSNTMSLTVR